MKKIWITKDKEGITIFDNEPYFDHKKQLWVCRENINFTFVDGLWVVKKFDLIPDPKYSYEFEITNEEYESFDWFC